MGQLCEGDRTVLDIQQQEAASMQVSNSKPLTMTAPPEDEIKLMAAPAPIQEEKPGPKNTAVLLEGGLTISQGVRRRLAQLGPFNLSTSAGDSEFAPDCQAYQLENGIQYQGEWQGNDIHGKGAFLLPDGSYLEANIVQNQVTGRGRLINANGDYYQGEFRNNQAHGHGRYQQGKVVLEGQFQNNLPQGTGIQIGQNFRFVGTFQGGCRKEGKLTWKEGLGNFTYNL